MGFPFSLMNASSLEVEFQKESERIIESMGWIEPEKVSSLITKGLKEKIEANARELNFLPKVARLPI